MAEAWTVATQWEENRRFDTAHDVVDYAERLCIAVYPAEVSHQLPFHATDEGSSWRIVGSRPFGLPTKPADPIEPVWPISGPLTIVVDKATGKVLEVFFAGAAAGWDFDIIKGLDREPVEKKTKPQ